jgi:hypothetical protein
MMNKLMPKHDGTHIPSAKGIEDDLDYLDILMSYALLDMEAKVREAKAINGK